MITVINILTSPIISPGTLVPGAVTHGQIRITQTAIEHNGTNSLTQLIDGYNTVINIVIGLAA